MTRIIFALLLLCCAAPVAGQDVVVTTTTVVSAQAQAEECARTGILKHCRILNGLREGIGFSSVGPQQAIESCCFYKDALRGRYKIVEKGVARGPRGWFAVVRYR